MLRKFALAAFLFSSLSTCATAPIAFAQSTFKPCTPIGAVGAQSPAGEINCPDTTRAWPLPVTGQTAIPTYSGIAAALAYTAAGDIYCITGSSTKTIKVKGIRLSAIAGSAAVIDTEIVLRSTVNTGGSPVSVLSTPSDPLNPTATATITAYTGASAPTAGTLIGEYRIQKTVVLASNASTFTQPALFQFTPFWDQPVILRDALHSVCVNVSAAGSGASFDIDHEHTEEPAGSQ